MHGDHSGEQQGVGKGDSTRDYLAAGQAVLGEADLLTQVAAHVGCLSLQDGGHLNHSHSCAIANVGLG